MITDKNRFHPRTSIKMVGARVNFFLVRRARNSTDCYPFNSLIHTAPVPVTLRQSECRFFTFKIDFFPSSGWQYWYFYSHTDKQVPTHRSAPKENCQGGGRNPKFFTGKHPISQPLLGKRFSKFFPDLSRENKTSQRILKFSDWRPLILQLKLVIKWLREETSPSPLQDVSVHPTPLLQLTENDFWEF